MNYIFSYAWRIISFEKCADVTAATVITTQHSALHFALKVKQSLIFKQILKTCHLTQFIHQQMHIYSDFG